MLVFFILVLIWGFVLVPPYLQARRESRPGDSIASFRQQLHVLERTTPGGRVSQLEAARSTPRSTVTQLADRRLPARGPARPAADLHRAELRRRRHDVFVTLLGAVVVSFLLAVALGGAVWMLHLLVDVAFVAYVAMLVSLQQHRMDQERKVRHLPPTAARRPPQPQLAIRRYGS